MIDIPIIFEDSSLIVINKPYGLVVNRSDTTAGKTETLQDWSENYIVIPDERSEDPESIKIEFLSRSGIVHRLDKDTSGLLIIAKTPEAFENLKNQFKNREVVKKYLALAHGKVEPPVGTINAPIERNPFNRMHFGIFPGGREAVTDYKVLSHPGGRRPIGSSYSLLELTPHTGRTHQIRVHLKYINHPIVSDPIYAGRKNSKNDLKICPRLFLHATQLSLKHPITNEALTFSSPLPNELQDVLDKLI